MAVGNMRWLDLHGVEWPFSLDQRHGRSACATNWGIGGKISLALADDLIVTLHRVCCLDMVYAPGAQNLKKLAKGRRLSDVTAIFTSFL